jgi:hypothetical protein
MGDAERVGSLVDTELGHTHMVELIRYVCNVLC